MARAFIVYDTETGGATRVAITQDDGALVLFGHETRLEIPLERGVQIEKESAHWRVENGELVPKTVLALKPEKLRLIVDPNAAVPDKLKVEFNSQHPPVLIVGGAVVNFSAALDPADAAWDKDTGAGWFEVMASAPRDIEISVAGPGLPGSGDAGDPFHYSDPSQGEEGKGGHLIINAKAPSNPDEES